MSLSSKISALRNLAERPGTEAEGIVARKMLKELQAKDKANPKTEKRQTLAEYWRDINGPVVLKCACGTTFMSDQKCSGLSRHDAIRAEILARFRRGDVVFYNKWAYSVNCRGVVIGFVKADADNWGWLRVKFDHLKSTRAIPIYSVNGWHLSKHPLNFTEIGNLRYPDSNRGSEWVPKLSEVS